jgi:prevent-host-death family protein
MSFTDILASSSGAARGAIYHHFPGGKTQLVAEAAQRNGAEPFEQTVRTALNPRPQARKLVLICLDKTRQITVVLMTSPDADHWQIQEAKQRFSEMIRAVASEGPQVITRHGEDVAVVVDIG